MESYDPPAPELEPWRRPRLRPALGRSAADHLRNAQSVPARPKRLSPTVLGLVDGRPLSVSIDERLRGTYAVGVTGSGKTTFLRSLIVQDLAAGRGLGVIDPHGQLVDHVLDHVAECGRERDVLLLDLSSRDVAFGLNLLSCPAPTDPEKANSTAELAFGIFKERWGDMSWGARMEDLLFNAILTLIANPGTTIADLIPLLTKDAYRKKLLTRVTDDVVKPFWTDEYDKLSTAARGQMIGPVTNKVRTLTRSPILGPIVGQSVNTVDWDAAIRGNRIVLVKLAPKLKEASGLIGTFMIQQILEAAFGRGEAEAQANPFMLYFDECHRFVTQGFATLLQEARKFGLATAAATQFDSKLPEDISTVFTGSSTVVCFRLGDQDAKRLQNQFDGSALALPTTFDPDPLSTLLSRGHIDTRLVDKARAVERALIHWQDKKDLYLKRRGKDHYVSSIATVVKQARLAIDAYLFAVQRRDKERADQLLRSVQHALQIDPARPSDDELYCLLRVAELGDALWSTPLVLGSATERGKVVFELSHLTAQQALVSYAAGLERAEALIHTTQPKPTGKPFRPMPLGIKREPPKPSPPESDELIYLHDPDRKDDPDAPPPFIDPH